MVRETINPADLATPVGPYSWGVKTKDGSLLFISGCVAFDADGSIAGKGDIRKQTEVTMENLKRVVEAAGGSLKDIVKITNYVRNADDFPKLAEVRKKYLTAPFPASTLIEVKRLLYEDLLIEIEAIAVIPDKASLCTS